MLQRFVQNNLKEDYKSVENRTLANVYESATDCIQYCKVNKENFSLLWKDRNGVTKCSCASWNLTEMTLYSLERDNNGKCMANCSSQMCGVHHNDIQSVAIFKNKHYDLLIRNCDDVFLQPVLPYNPPPYPIRPTDAAEDILVSWLPKNLTLLVTPHHGSRSSSSSSVFVRHLAPKWAVHSAGRGNRYGHPHDIVMQRYGLENSSQVISGYAGGVTWDSLMPGHLLTQRDQWLTEYQ